jgi:hypothetical protein
MIAAGSSTFRAKPERGSNNAIQQINSLNMSHFLTEMLIELSSYPQIGRPEHAKMGHG